MKQQQQKMRNLVLILKLISSKNQNQSSLQLILRETLSLTGETRDAFRKGILMKFYLSQPLMILNEETQEKLPKLKEVHNFKFLIIYSI